jgi:hypothetical protein
LPSGALKGRCAPAQGNALGTRVPPPSQRPERVQQPHLTHRRSRPQPWALFRCPVGASEAVASGSVDAGTGLTCGGGLPAVRRVPHPVRALDRGRRFPQGVALGWYVLPFQGRRTTRRAGSFGALKGRCTPTQGNALGTRVPLPHSTLTGCGNRTSHTGAQGRNPVGVGGEGWNAQPRVAARTPQPWALFHCPVGASETGRTMGRERGRSEP